MDKVFEDYFEELHRDMVSICLEYVENDVDDIYIYCSYEPPGYYFDVFYRMGSKVLQKGKVNDSGRRVFDVSKDRQLKLLQIGREGLKKLHDKYIDFNRDMPTEIKTIYSASEKKMYAECSYELKYSNTDDMLPGNIFDMWYEEIKNKWSTD